MSTSNESSRAWSGEILQAAAERMELASCLLEATPLPQDCASDGGHDDWPLVGVALMARAFGTLQSITALFPVRRETDAYALVRILLEHVTTFAWLAADPELRMPMWLKKDRDERVKMDNDFRSAGHAFLDADVRAAYERIRDADGVSMPDVAARAHAADRHWGSKIPELEPDARNHASFSGLYRLLFRGGSQRVHVSALGLDRLISDVMDRSGVLHVGRHERPPRTLNAFTIAPIVYGVGLFVAAETLPGWPSRADVNGIFESGSTAGRAG